LIADVLHSRKETVEKTEDSCRFTESRLERSDSVEVLSLKKQTRKQLMLLNDIRHPEPSVTTV